MLFQWPDNSSEVLTFKHHLANVLRGGLHPVTVAFDGFDIEELLNMKPEDMRQTLIRIRKALD